MALHSIWNLPMLLSDLKKKVGNDAASCSPELRGFLCMEIVRIEPLGVQKVLGI